MTREWAIAEKLWRATRQLQQNSSKCDNHFALLDALCILGCAIHAVKSGTPLNLEVLS